LACFGIGFPFPAVQFVALQLLRLKDLKWAPPFVQSGGLHPTGRPDDRSPEIGELVPVVPQLRPERELAAESRSEGDHCTNSNILNWRLCAFRYIEHPRAKGVGQ